jgi:ABC-type branched-subunit amino acid transport system substrate-binding protein
MGNVHRRVTVACVAIVAIALSACGSGTSTAKSATSTTPTTAVNAPQDKTLGKGVTANTIKLGVALVNFSAIESYTDLIRSSTEQKQIYQLYIDNINAHGGINGRKIVPYYKYYSPIGSAGILALCTSLAQDDNVFAVVGTFVDFSGDAQTCVANQQKRVLMTYYLTQSIINKSPAGLIVTPGDMPERAAAILIQLLQKQHTLTGKTVAVLGDTTEAAVVNNSVVPVLKSAGVTMGATAILDIGTSGDFTAAQIQLDSFIEKWKTEHVDAVFLSGNLASNKPFVEKVKKEIPNVVFMADTTDVLSQAQQVQQAGIKPNPYEGILTAGGLTAKESDASENWKYCADIYQTATGKPAPDAEHTIKLPNGKIDDTHGAISDACQLVSMFQDIATKVGPYLNNTNWISTVDNFGPIPNRGSGPYSSLRTGKYSADDNWRLQEYDSSLGNTGLWKPVTPLEDITG